MDCFEDEGGGVVWPDPLRALFMLYEPLSRVVAEQLGPDDAADYLAAALVCEEELSEGRGGSERFAAAWSTVCEIESAVVIPW